MRRAFAYVLAGVVTLLLEGALMLLVSCASGPPLPPLVEQPGDPTAPEPIDPRNPYAMTADGGCD